MEQIPHCVLGRQFRRADQMDPARVGTDDVALAIGDTLDRERLPVGQLGEVGGHPDGQARGPVARLDLEGRAADPAEELLDGLHVPDGLLLDGR